MSFKQGREVKAVFSDDEYEAIRQLCNQYGWQHGEFVVRAVRDWMVDKMVHMDSPMSRLVMLDYKSRMNESADEMLMRIARNFLSTGDEDIYEELKKVCDDLGKSPENYIDALSINPVLANIGPISSTELGKCIHWLGTRLLPGQEVATTEIFEEGLSMGFKKYLVKDAKKKMGIVSVRGNGQWFWRYEQDA